VVEIKAAAAAQVDYSHLLHNHLQLILTQLQLALAEQVAQVDKVLMVTIHN
jgi:hypothetical protein